MRRPCPPLLGMPLVLAAALFMAACANESDSARDDAVPSLETGPVATGRVDGPDEGSDTAADVSRPAGEGASAPKTDPQPEDAIAQVGDLYVTEQDLRRGVIMTLPRQLRARALREARGQMVEATIRRKAMAQVAEQDLSPDELGEIEQVVADYREQLLANALVNKASALEPVTDEVIRDYYDTHPELWAGAVSARFELLWVDEDLSGDQKAEAAQRIQVLVAQPVWKALIEKADPSVKGLRYWTGRSELDALDPAMRDFLEPVPEGSTSRPSWINGRLYLARVQEREAEPAKPLAEVREQIRRTLKAQRLKKAMADLDGVYRDRVKVRYIASPEHNGEAAER